MSQDKDALEKEQLRIAVKNVRETVFRDLEKNSPELWQFIKANRARSAAMLSLAWLYALALEGGDFDKDFDEFASIVAMMREPEPPQDKAKVGRKNNEIIANLVKAEAEGVLTEEAIEEAAKIITKTIELVGMKKQEAIALVREKMRFRKGYEKRTSEEVMPVKKTG